MSVTAPSSFERARRSAPGRAVTATGKRVLRAGGMATARWRPTPELIIVGAKRGGTTSLWRYLSEHPGVLPTFPAAEKIKGTYFFDEGWSRGEAWYRSHFPTTFERQRVARRLGYAPVTLEASPYYLFHPLAPNRARQIAPDAVIVAVLRDPVERAFSHWKERGHHTETLRFRDALDAEAARTAGIEAAILADPGLISPAHRHETYVAQGRYAPMLQRWFEAFGRDQVVVAAAEDFYADPQALCDQLTDRVGLPRRPLLHAEPFNSEPSPDMDPEVRERLRVELAADIAEVERLLGRQMPW